jgi:lipopolysaccharide transport system ATP-binding protein
MTAAVQFQDVSKRYTPRGAAYASLRDDLVHLPRRLFNLLPAKKRRSSGIMALDHVSFELPEGEACAVIGPNGAGKTTLLRLVTRITYPTGGRLRVRGRVAALIEVGSGIHPELTGRENIWLYGRILGMSGPEIARRFDDIVDFAELAPVLDTPVKFYSSGMALRLGFSVASHLDPDIFVVDEALSVGDATFQARCVNRMLQLVSEGHTLLFVSHHLPAVEALCRRGIFLVDGKVHTMGGAREVLATYLDWVDHKQEERIKRDLQRAPGSIVIEDVSFYGADGGARRVFHTGEDIEVRLKVRTATPLERPSLWIGITDGRPGPLIMCSTASNGDGPAVINGTATISLRLQKVPLAPRIYEAVFAVRDWHGVGGAMKWRLVGTFRIEETAESKGHGPLALSLASIGGPVHVDHEWAW